MSIEAIRARAEVARQRADRMLVFAPEQAQELTEDIDLLLAVAEAAKRFKHFADQINGYNAGLIPDADNAERVAWLDGLHAAQEDVDRGLDALEAAP